MQLIFIVVAFGLLLFPYASNGYKLSQCDFEAPYKCEAIHGIGVIIPPAAFVTFWFDHDSEDQD